MARNEWNSMLVVGDDEPPLEVRKTECFIQRYPGRSSQDPTFVLSFHTFTITMYSMPESAGKTRCSAMKYYLCIHQKCDVLEEM